METIKDLSGNKRNDRLIYMVSINDDITKYVKITPNSEPEYNAEINIYKELNTYMKNDKKIKNKILKICNNDFIDNICNDIELRLYENITCNLTFENSKNVKYSIFVPMLIKAIQEQQAQIEELSNRLIKLESK